MDTAKSGTLDTVRRIGFRVTITMMVVLTSACGGSAPLRMSEQNTISHPAGTLLLGEVVGDLSRQEISGRYSPGDLEIAGWKPAEVADAIAVVAVNFKQSQRVAFGTQVNQVHGLYAVVSRDLAPSLNVHRDRSARRLATNTSFGGDTVTIRVVRPSPSAQGLGGLNVVESVVEPANVQGDCVYDYRNFAPSQPEDRRRALFCKSLVEKGWVWIGDEFAKRPTVAIPK